MQAVRIDDYPHGNPGYDIRDCRDKVARALAIFEQYKVPYILGATPFLMDGSDIAFLNEHVKTGKVVMHGFDHALHFKPWERITDIWPMGGEFRGMRTGEIGTHWTFGSRLLSQVHQYDPTHFIPPFNCYTQEALDALSEKGVRYWHGCDKEFDAYGYGALNHHGMCLVTSRYHHGYDYARLVKTRLGDPHLGPITLHWVFDSQEPGWEMEYHQLCQGLVARG
jgi:hypothetical protein